MNLHNIFGKLVIITPVILVMAQPEISYHRIVKMESFDIGDDYKNFIYIDTSFSGNSFWWYHKLNWYEYVNQTSQWELFDEGISRVSDYLENVDFISDIEITGEDSTDILLLKHTFHGVEGNSKELWRNDTYVRFAGIFGSYSDIENVVQVDPTNDSTIYLSLVDYYPGESGFFRSEDYGQTWSQIFDTLSYQPWVSADEIKISPFDNTNIILSGEIYQAEPFALYSYISTSDYGDNWYGNPTDRFLVNDFEFISEDSVIFHTDNGRYISSEKGSNPTYYDSLISTTTYYDFIDNQFYFNMGKSLLYSDTKGLSYSVLIDSLDSEIIDIYGVKNSDSVYICTGKSVYIYSDSAIDTIFILPDDSLKVTNEPSIPENFMLHQNYPNPFNSGTVIPYELQNGGSVTVDIFNLLGQRIRTLVDKKQWGGDYFVRWDGLNDLGEESSSGIYLYRLSVKQDGNETLQLVRKMVLMR